MSLSTFEAFKRIGKTEETIELSGEVLSQLQQVLLHVLGDIDSVCRSIGITYTLGGGTCLGAVRHRGFIPWDDDLDVNMTRADFIKFRAELIRLFPDKYWIHVPGETPGYDLAFPRIRLRGTVARGRDDIGAAESGVSVDIFFVENVPNNVIARGIHCFGSLAIGFAYSCRRFTANSRQYLQLADGDREVVRIFKKKALLGILFSFLTAEQWARIWDKWNGMCDYDTSRYVCIPVGRKHYSGEIYLRDRYFPISRGTFDGLEVPLPADPDMYLSNLYGSDYMKIPPKKDRETHLLYEFDLGKYAATND